VSAQFYELCDTYGWERGDDERAAAYTEYGNALSQSFNDTYGTNANDLSSWQNLCRVLEMKPIPRILEACQDVSTTARIFARAIILNRDNIAGRSFGPH
jgi:hypothetical protein